MRVTCLNARVFFFALAFMAAMIGHANADAIDGTWCHGDGRTMFIEGPSITIPSGKRIAGDYDRHGFSYVVPEGEPGAGARIEMTLINEDTVRLTRGVPPGSAAEPEPELWRRCKPVA